MAIALSTIAMLVLGLRYMSLAYAQVIGSVVTSVLFIWTGRRFPAFIIGINEWRRVALFSSPCYPDWRCLQHFAKNFRDVASQIGGGWLRWGFITGQAQSVALSGAMFIRS